MLVYRLVAMAFVPVPEKYQGIPIEELEVHHINFNHNENLASNLMWLTKAEHMQLHSDSEVTKQRKSKPKSEEHKRNLSEALKGRVFSEEHINHLREANKGEKNPMYGNYGEKNPMYGKHHTEETRKKMSEKRKLDKHPLWGKHHTEETKRKLSEANGKPVIQYTLEGEFVAKYQSMMDAAKQTGIRNTYISNCCSGKQKSAGGFKWRYAA